MKIKRYVNKERAIFIAKTVNGDIIIKTLHDNFGNTRILSFKMLNGRVNYILTEYIEYNEFIKEIYGKTYS